MGGNWELADDRRWVAAMAPAPEKSQSRNPRARSRLLVRPRSARRTIDTCSSACARARSLFLILDREIVLNRLHARDFPCGPRRLGAGGKVRDFAGQGHDPRIGLDIDIGVVQTRVLCNFALDVVCDRIILFFY